MPEAQARVQQQLEDKIIAGLRLEGIRVVSQHGDGILEARIDMTNVDLREYTIGLDLVLDGEREALIHELKCRPCSEAGVVQQTVALLPAAARRLEAVRVVPEPVVEAKEPERAGSEENELGPLGITGAATVGGGVLTIVAGGVLMGTTPLGDPTNVDYVDVRGPGTALLAVGTAATLLGATALVLDLVVLARRRGERDKRVDVTPSFSATGAGLRLSGRF
ncbi:hypothetical protein [Enhygromyxa salina]|nr:hypothetical protein [Enhygromyxa salina]